MDDILGPVSTGGALGGGDTSSLPPFLPCMFWTSSSFISSFKKQGEEEAVHSGVNKLFPRRGKQRPFSSTTRGVSARKPLDLAAPPIEECWATATLRPDVPAPPKLGRAIQAWGGGGWDDEGGLCWILTLLLALKALHGTTWFCTKLNWFRSRQPHWTV